MKNIFIAAAIVFAWMMGIFMMCNERDKSYYQDIPDVDLVEFELVRDSLYDSAMTICTGLAEWEGGCFYTDVDAESVAIFKQYRVPNLEVLLGILDQIDDQGCIYDVYDDDEGTLDEYYTLRERYENYF